MAQNNTKTLHQRKMELEAKLKTIENELDNTVDKVKTDVSSSLNPLQYIKRYPLPAFMTSIFIGYLISKGGSDDKKKSELSSTLWNELSKMAVRKGVDLLSKQIDQIIEQRTE